MRKLLFPVILVCMSTVQSETKHNQPYQEIRIKDVFSKLIVRDRDDRICSGLITSEKGLSSFAQHFNLDIDDKDIVYEKQMLIYGVTDIISTRAYRFLKNKRIHAFCLDYFDTGIEYELLPIKKSEKYSFVQVFVVDRIVGVSNIRVKNVVLKTCSKKYD